MQKVSPKIHFYWIFLLYLGCLCPHLLLGQGAAAAVVPTQPVVEIGDSIHLRVVVSGTQAKPDRVEYGQWSAFFQSNDVLSATVFTRNGTNWISEQTVVIFDSVGPILPPIQVRLLTGELVASNPVVLTVKPPAILGEISEMEANRTIRQHNLRWSDFALMTAIALGIFGLFALAIRRRKKKQAPPPPPQERILPVAITQEEAPVPAHDQALRELARLSRERLWEKGQVKEFYAELSLILRQYLEHRYQIDAPESTTREIEAMLRQTNFPIQRLADLKKVLEQADMAKFAQALGSDWPHEHFILRSEEFIKQTADAP